MGSEYVPQEMRVSSRKREGRKRIRRDQNVIRFCKTHIGHDESGVLV
jgi:hypothetical protein